MDLSTFKVSFGVYSFVFHETFRFTFEVSAKNIDEAIALTKERNPLAEDIVAESKFVL